MQMRVIGVIEKGKFVLVGLTAATLPSAAECTELAVSKTRRHNSGPELLLRIPIRLDNVAVVLAVLVSLLVSCSIMCYYYKCVCARRLPPQDTREVAVPVPFEKELAAVIQGCSFATNSGSAIYLSAAWRPIW
jgi:hypothetical protein